MFASSSGHTEAVKLLLEAGASTTLADVKGEDSCDKAATPVNADMLAAAAVKK